MKFEDYAGNIIETEKCPACEYAEHKFSLPCGLIFENELLTISQDWEIPIVGFVVISLKRHIESLTELSEQERNETFFYVNQTLKYLKKNKVCEEYNVLFEEKKGRHFHIWLFPRQNWMIEKFGNPTKNIKEIFDYALINLKNEENFCQVEKVASDLRDCFKR